MKKNSYLVIILLIGSLLVNFYQYSNRPAPVKATPITRAERERLNATISNVRAEEMREDRNNAKMMVAMEEEYDARKAIFESKILSHLRPATVEDYRAWLRGYMSRGGKISHSYDYELPTEEMFVATSDFEMIPLYGAMAIHVIVPKGINVKYNDTGHSNLYFMDGYRVGSCFNGHGAATCDDGSEDSLAFVPVYSNVTF